VGQPGEADLQAVHVERAGGADHLRHDDLAIPEDGQVGVLLGSASQLVEEGSHGRHQVEAVVEEPVEAGHLGAEAEAAMAQAHHVARVLERVEDVVGGADARAQALGDGLGGERRGRGGDGLQHVEGAGDRGQEVSGLGRAGSLPHRDPHRAGGLAHVLREPAHPRPLAAGRAGAARGRQLTARRRGGKAGPVRILKSAPFTAARERGTLRS